MAKVDYAYPVEALHGKVKKTHEVGFAQRQDTGCKFTQDREGYTMVSTAAQMEVQTKLANASKAAHTRMADPQYKVQDLLAFKNQKKYKTLYGYVFSQVYNS